MFGSCVEDNVDEAVRKRWFYDCNRGFFKVKNKSKRNFTVLISECPFAVTAESSSTGMTLLTTDNAKNLDSYKIKQDKDQEIDLVPGQSTEFCFQTSCFSMTIFDKNGLGFVKTINGDKVKAVEISERHFRRDSSSTADVQTITFPESPSSKPHRHGGQEYKA